VAIRWRVADEESLQRSPLDHVHRTQGHVWWASADGIRPCAPLQPTVTRPVSTHSQANLVGANLVGADLEGANLEGANLEGAYLEGAYLEGAYLTWANLVGADLRVAYLVGAYLGESFLNGAKVNEDTTWPEGFDPVAARVTFKD